MSGRPYRRSPSSTTRNSSAVRACNISDNAVIVSERAIERPGIVACRPCWLPCWSDFTLVPSTPNVLFAIETLLFLGGTVSIVLGETFGFFPATAWGCILLAFLVAVLIIAVKVVGDSFLCIFENFRSRARVFGELYYESKTFGSSTNDADLIVLQPGQSINVSQFLKSSLTSHDVTGVQVADGQFVTTISGSYKVETVVTLGIVANGQTTTAEITASGATTGPVLSKHGPEYETPYYYGLVGVGVTVDNKTPKNSQYSSTVPYHPGIPATDEQNFNFPYVISITNSYIVNATPGTKLGTAVTAQRQALPSIVVSSGQVEAVAFYVYGLNQIVTRIA